MIDVILDHLGDVASLEKRLVERSVNFETSPEHVARVDNLELSFAPNIVYHKGFFLN